MIDATVATDDQMQFDLEGSEHTGAEPNQVWDSPIGPILISTDIRRLCELLSNNHGLADPCTPEMDVDAKVAARQQVISDFLQTLETKKQFDEVMNKMSLPWGQVRTADSIREQPTIAHRGAIVDIDDRQGGTRPVTQSPYRFSSASSGVRGPAPHRGEHNSSVLKGWLGYEDSVVEELYAAGVLSRSEEAQASD